jgi:hypothetical protein
MKRYIGVGILVVIAIITDSLFEYMRLPIVTMDLLLVPFSIAIVTWICTPKFLAGEYLDRERVRNQKGFNLIAAICFAIFLVVLSVFLIYAGLSNPLQLFTGVRGNGHGYTLAITGLAMMLFVLFTAYVYIFKKNAP